VTVCIATLFRWNYATKGQPENYGFAALVASDRMITAGDVEYEPRQLKVAYMTPRSILLIAGQYPIHTQAIRIVAKQIEGRQDTTSPETIAVLYGKAIQTIRQRQAEDIFLAPLGLNTDTFAAQQRDLSERFVEKITDQLQHFDGPDIEAMVVGSDNDRSQVWSIDFRGTVRNYDDVGFHAIGIGAGHASSSLMQARYTNSWGYASSLAVTYAAKKAAETAPGVGTDTDMHLVTKHAVIKLWDNAFAHVERIFQKYREAQAKLVLDSISELDNALAQAKPGAEANGGSEQATIENPETNERIGTDAAEAPRGNESREEEGVSAEACKTGES
jgi:20S proteasome alpha/beta subunit